MKKLILLVTFVSTGLFLAAQDATFNDENVEKRSVKAFRSIKVGDGVDLYLSQGGEESVAVSASRDEYRNRLKTEVEDGVLKIYYDRESLNDWTSGGKKLKAYVSFKTLDKLSASAGADVHVQGVIKEEALNIFLNSGASIRGKIEARKLVMEAESGAHATLSGSVATFNLNANSGAKVSAYDLAAGKADLRSTTGAKIEITVNEEIKVSASTGGNIHYKGDAKISDVNTRLGGGIKKVNG
jgi:Putative auto-transporter adhesin, head GIN domain